MKLPSFTLTWPWQQGQEKTAEPEVLLSGEAVARPVSVVLVLVLCIVVSAFVVIFAAYEYRVLFNQQQQLVQEWDDLQVEWGQLLLEQSALGANSRVEELARAKLSMKAPTPKMTEIVEYEHK